MSHISKIELEVKDLPSSAQACSRLGLELIRSKNIQMVREGSPVRPLPSGCPGASYEIGVIDTGRSLRAQLRFL